MHESAPDAHGFLVAPEFAGADISSARRRAYGLELNGMVEAGSLKFSLNYDTCQFGAHSMLALAEEIGAAWREVIDSCTRSDSAGPLRAPQMNPHRELFALSSRLGYAL